MTKSGYCGISLSSKAKKIDVLPDCDPPSPEAQKVIDRSVKARADLVESPKYAIRLAKSYLKNMTCSVINTEHRTYSDEPKLLCVTLPASLVEVLVEFMEENYHEDETKK